MDVQLPPGRACAARRRADARGSHDLIDGGRRDRDAKSGQFAVDLLASLFPTAHLRCQASSVAGVTGKIPAQRPRGSRCASAASHTRSACLRPACRAARVLVPERQQLSILGQVTAEHQDEAEYPQNYRVRRSSAAPGQADPSSTSTRQATAQISRATGYLKRHRVAE